MTLGNTGILASLEGPGRPDGGLGGEGGRDPSNDPPERLAERRVRQEGPCRGTRCARARLGFQDVKRFLQVNPRGTRSGARRLVRAMTGIRAAPSPRLRCQRTPRRAAANHLLDAAVGGIMTNAQPCCAGPWRASRAAPRGGALPPSPAALGPLPCP